MKEQLAIQKIRKAYHEICGDGDLATSNETAIDSLVRFAVEHDASLLHQLHINGIYQVSAVIDYDKRLIRRADQKYQAQGPDYDDIDCGAIRDELQDNLDEIRHRESCIAADDGPIIFPDTMYPYYQMILAVEPSYLLDVLTDVARGLGYHKEL